MLLSDFIELAGFPERWQEKDLQMYIAHRLEERGFKTALEVKVNGGRADIVTDWLDGSIIEVKKYLNRDTIYQASGQLSLYGLNNQRKLVVMGFLTPDANAQSSAFTTASMIEQNQRIKVVFVNLESEWLPGAKITKVWNWLKLPRLPQLPQIPKTINWRWLLNLVLAHPLILAIAGLTLLTIFPPSQTTTQQEIKR